MDVASEMRLAEEIVKARRIAEVKDLLLKELHRLGLDKQTGNFSGSYPRLPQEIIESVQEQNAWEENDNLNTHDTKDIIPGKDLGDKCIKGRQVTGCYRFELKDQAPGKVTSAYLTFYKTEDPCDNGRQTLQLVQLMKTRSGRLQRRNMVIRQDTDVKEGWITMNITRSVKRWVDRKMSTVMMAIRCDTCRTRDHRALFGEKNGFQPLIVIDYHPSYAPSQTERRTRSNSGVRCDARYRCCKKFLQINFRRSLVNIYRPAELAINYCFGDCSNPAQHNIHNHTDYMMIVKHRDTNIPANIRQQLVACCVPDKLRGVSYIAYGPGGSNRFIHGFLPSASVSTCGCL